MALTHLARWDNGVFVKPVKVLVALLILGIVAVGVFVYSGSYAIGADVPHTRPVRWLLQTVRERAIAVQSRGVQVPIDLSDPARIADGAGQYAAMCSGCHLAPGYDSGETWRGLYPQPPRLARGVDLTAAQIFWVLKHGLKLTGMPAWGPTHSDRELWDLTAFVVRLPHLGAQQYRDVVVKAPMDADMTMMPMPGAKMSGHRE